MIRQSRLLARATYALFVALLPATATAIGVVVLRQLPSALDLAGIALVTAGVALHREKPPPGFSNVVSFIQLRISPFFWTVAQRHPVAIESDSQNNGSPMALTR